MDIKIKIDSRALDKVLSSLSQKTTLNVIREGLTVAARSAKKKSVDDIYETYNLKKKDIAVMTRIKRPTEADLTSSVTIGANPIAITKFKPTQKKAGISVRVFRGGGREVIQSAFLTPIKGKEQPMIRTRAIKGDAKRYVMFPSSMPTHRNKKGGELPINRLLADPVSEVIRPSADSIAARAAGDAAVKMFERVETILDKGKV